MNGGFHIDIGNRDHDDDWRRRRGGWGPQWGPAWGPQWGPRYPPPYRRPWGVGDLIGSALGTAIGNAINPPEPPKPAPPPPPPPSPTTVIVQQAPPVQSSGGSGTTSPIDSFAEAMKKVASVDENGTVSLNLDQYHALIDKKMVDFDADKNSFVMKRRINVPT